MLVPITNIDQIGVVKDQKDYELPLNAWTNARNVRARDGKIEKFRGDQTIFDPPSVAPYWLLHTIDGSGASLWVYAGLGKVYAYDGLHTDISRTVGGAYNATGAGLWNGGILQGVAILNNGIDVPQSWSSPPVVATKLVAMPNWLAASTAKVIRPHREFLVAMDTTESGTRFMHRVRISHPAAPGNVPSSWNDADPTTEAIKKDLTDTYNGRVIDGATLGAQFIVYKEHAAHAFQYIGGLFKWRAYLLFSQVGLIAKNCIGQFEDQQKREMHLIYSGEDVVVHNGIQAQSLLDRRQRRWLMNNVSVANAERSFVVASTTENEIWVCVPLEGATFPNHALVWNVQTNTLTQRDLNETSFISPGKIPATPQPWDSDPNPWDTDTTPWDEFSHATFLNQLVGARPAATKLFQLDISEQFSGSSFEAFIERTGLDAYGVDRSGRALRDANKFKLVKSILPKVEGGPIEVRLATQETKEGPITWSAPQTFSPGNQVRQGVDFDLPCRLYGVQFRSHGNVTWKLQDYEVDVEPLGDY